MTHSEAMTDQGYYDLMLHPIVREALSEMIESVLIRDEDSTDALQTTMNFIQDIEK